MNTIAYLKACAQPFDSEQYHNEGINIWKDN